MYSYKSALGVATVAASMVLIAGCNSEVGPTVSAPSTTASPSTSVATQAPSESPTTTASPTNEPISYEVGTCLNDQPEWKAVDCDSRHFFEVSAVVKDSRYAGDLVKRSAYRNSVCDAKTAKYIDGPAYGSMLLAEPLPVAADPDNAKQIVCVVSEHKGDDSGIISRTGSLEGALKGDGFYDYQMCLEGKASAAEVKITPCDGPHVSEATYGFIMGKWGDKYPGSDKVNKTSLEKCKKYDRKYLGAERSDISLAQNSSGKGPWDKGHRLTVCFVQVNHGKVTKSLKGIGHKSLSSYR